MLLISSGGFNLYTNYLGDFCTNEESSEGCKLNWMSSLSLPNKMNNSDAMEMQQNLNLFSCFLIILVLIFFRRSQRVINSKIDEQQNSVADYSIMVKNIPTNINSDYVKALTEFFSNNIDPVKKYNVTKVNLLWELDEIEEFKEKIDKMIVKKKNLLVNFKYDHENQSIKQCNESIEKNELDLDDQFKKIEKSPEYFAGMAFVSFRTEDGNYNFLI